jgi:hypothetical protein
MPGAHLQMPPANASPHAQTTLEGLNYRALGTCRWRLQSAETEIDPIGGSRDVGNGTPSPKTCQQRERTGWFAVRYGAAERPCSCDTAVGT